MTAPSGTAPDLQVASGSGRPPRRRSEEDDPPSPLLGAVAFAVLGAGLVDVALAAGHGGHAGWAWVLLALGVLQVGWAVAALAVRRPPLPHVTARALLLAAAGWTVVVAQGIAATAPGVPMTAADAGVVLLQLVAAGGIGLVVRTAPRRPAVGAARALTGWALAAILTAAVVTPALASTGVGEQAVPDGGAHHSEDTRLPEDTDRGHADH
ncbi:hypothetical protein J4G33_11175 [Actinotalea sp. BY-33]|uniref:Uncharacterized protein n=1 Tax=Actinotalea soli TaxID=2819234 RepID=A0A939RVG1_9CELL|nr:hypothetical protein [Actinotalea soli]MBO1752365.1 hypothetical protein [Actinotalea soli]